MLSASAQPPGPVAAASTLRAAPQAISSGDLILTVAAQTVHGYPSAPLRILTAADVQAALTPLPQLNPFPIPLLRGPLADIRLYSRTEETRWLHELAHDICDPVHRAGTLWVRNMSSGHWIQAAPTDQLLPAIYEYRAPPGVHLCLSKFSVRHRKSQTEAIGNGATMRREVMARDQRCWITGGGSGVTTTNSHICPKRMGDAMATHIYNEFCGATANLVIYDAQFGICLVRTLDALFDIYELGLRQIGSNPDVYEAHNFHTDVPINMMTYLGIVNLPGLPLLHGHQVHPPQPQTTDPVPPPGLFRWHYMQCVLRRFGTLDYKELPNIKHYELPFRSEDDDDDDDDDQFEDDGTFDWPSAVFDRGRMQARVEAERAEQLARVVRWIAT